MDIISTLCAELKIEKYQAENTVKLLDEGNTVPFISRYRKELTGSLDDQIVRELSERLVYLRNFEETKEKYRAAIDEQGKLTDEISAAFERAKTLAELEDIYRPFRPKKRTRASIARERGLEPLALAIYAQDVSVQLAELAAEFVDEERGVPDTAAALAGAMDIIAEALSDDADIRGIVRRVTHKDASLVVKATAAAESVYEMYYDYAEPVRKIPGHRVLAINRGEAENFLSVKLEAPAGEIIARLNKTVNKGNVFCAEFISEAVKDSYERLIAPSIEREIRNGLTERAEESAMRVFAENLKQLLMQPPIKDKTVLALDPGYRAGCKIAAVDGTGKMLTTGVIYPTFGEAKIEEGKRVLRKIIKDYDVDLLAIGNGTASRETEQFAVDLLKTIDKKIYYVMVNEAGASVYSASKLGAEEFPDLDVNVRSAVSIGRRLQDPLAELVKIDPKSIGVGQYQHDMNQKRLSETLGGVVEACVNNVGVDLNTASPSLLSYVAGISASVSRNILDYREKNGKFKTRRELIKVAKLGPKAFEQCAGFLRIPESDNPLDNTGVHPESYDVAKALLASLGYSPQDIGKIRGLKADAAKLAKELNVGVPTLKDILNELEKPGRDPREDMPAPILRGDVLKLEDLEEGMVLTGTVRNVIDFGVFVDIGVHQDGLVHISQICGRFIKHPLEAVSLGDIVKVRVLSVDAGKKRISLTMKGVAE